MRSSSSLVARTLSLPGRDSSRPLRPLQATKRPEESGRGRLRACATQRRGGALLAVLWLSAALAAIAFTVATTVRGETERAATLADSLRTHYLAAGGIERALMFAQSAVLRWQPEYPNTPPAYNFGPPLMRCEFPSGVALVEIIPENAKLSLNEGASADFYKLLLALEVDPVRAGQIASAIVDWRSPGGSGAFDQYYLALTPSFRARHASFEEVEEALLVRGMTPDIFYGTYTRDRQGRMVRLTGFRDCVSVYGAVKAFDVNTAEPALLSAIGLGPELARQIVIQRRTAPFKDLRQLGGLGGSRGRLTVGGNTIFTFRSTARLRLPGGAFSDVRRTVAAQVKFRRPGHKQPYQVLRWYDQTTSEISQWQ